MNLTIAKGMDDFIRGAQRLILSIGLGKEKLVAMKKIHAACRERFKESVQTAGMFLVLNGEFCIPLCKITTRLSKRRGSPNGKRQRMNMAFLLSLQAAIIEKKTSNSTASVSNPIFGILLK